MKITQVEWEAKGLELFGPDKENLRVQCPASGHICSFSISR